MTLKKAVTFNYLLFEKADENRKHKRPLVAGERLFCATPLFAYKMTEDELKTLAQDLNNGGNASLLCKAIESNNFQPFLTVETSCNEQKESKLDCQRSDMHILRALF